MRYVLLVFNAKGKVVYCKMYEGVSGTFMHDIYKDYEYLGGKGGYADFYPCEL